MVDGRTTEPGIIDILGQVNPGAPSDLPGADVDEIKPGIFPSDNAVTGHERRQSYQREVVSEKPRGNELVCRTLADQRQTIVGLNHLAERPLTNPVEFRTWRQPGRPRCHHPPVYPDLGAGVRPVKCAPASLSFVVPASA
jgi:hypothetical protein